MKRTFLLYNGPRIIVRRLHPAPDWNEGGRLFGYIGGLFGFGGRKVVLYFEGSTTLGKLAGIWTLRPRVRIYPNER